jgi:hypothetical protein
MGKKKPRWVEDLLGRAAGAADEEKRKTTPIIPAHSSVLLRVAVEGAVASNFSKFLGPGFYFNIPGATDCKS